jgi:hypothetical protein
LSRSSTIRRLLLFAAAHYAVLLALGGLIFLTSHLPSKVINLDALTNVLVHIEDVLVLPRRLLFRFWPYENTPRSFGFILTLANSLCWGAVLAAVQSWRSRRA